MAGLREFIVEFGSLEAVAASRGRSTDAMTASTISQIISLSVESIGSVWEWKPSRTPTHLVRSRPVTYPPNAAGAGTRLSRPKRPPKRCFRPHIDFARKALHVGRTTRASSSTLPRSWLNSARTSAQC